MSIADAWLAFSLILIGGYIAVKFYKILKKELRDQTNV